MPFKVGTILKNVGIITDKDIQQALDYQKQTGDLFGESLVHLNLCNKEELNFALSTQITNTNNVHKKGLNLKELSLIFKEIFLEKKYLVQLLLLGLFSAVFSESIIIPLILGFIIDHIIPSGNIIILFKACILAVSAFSLGYLFEFFSIIVGSLLNVKIGRKIASAVFTHINCLYYPFFVKFEKGDMLSRLSENIDSVTRHLEGFIPFFFKHVILFFISLSFLIYISFPLTIVGFLIVMMTLILPILLSNKSNKYLNKIPDFLGKITLFLKEILSSSLYIKQNNKIKKLSSIFKERLKYFYINDAGKWMGWNNSFNAKVFFHFLMSSTILYYGGHLVIDDKLTIGNLLTYYILISQLMNKMDYFYRFYLSIQVIKSDWRRIKVLLDFPSEKPEIVLENSSRYQGIKESIEISKLCYKHNLNGNDILKNIDLKLKKNNIYPIIGKSGCGKSTFIKILLGFYKPSSGNIYYDSKVITHFSFYELWSNIAYMEQETFIFTDRSLYDNILLGAMMYNEDISEQNIIEASKKAKIFELINSLPNGFNTIPDRDNIQLSGGEKQRIALARVFLKNPSVIIMDEPTSALDDENSKIIFEVIKKESAGKIILLSTHNIDFIKTFNNLIYFKKGELEFIENNNAKVKSIIKNFKNETENNYE